MGGFVNVFDRVFDKDSDKGSDKVFGEDFETMLFR
jgi:hypothetical protein